MLWKVCVCACVCYIRWQVADRMLAPKKAGEHMEHIPPSSLWRSGCWLQAVSKLHSCPEIRSTEYRELDKSLFDCKNFFLNIPGTLKNLPRTQNFPWLKVLCQELLGAGPCCKEQRSVKSICIVLQHKSTVCLKLVYLIFTSFTLCLIMWKIEQKKRSCKQWTDDWVQEPLSQFADEEILQDFHCSMNF